MIISSSILQRRKRRLKDASVYLTRPFMEWSPFDPVPVTWNPVYTASGERTNLAAVSRTNRWAGGKYVSPILRVGRGGAHWTLGEISNGRERQSKLRSLSENCKVPAPVSSSPSLSICCPPTVSL